MTTDFGPRYLKNKPTKFNDVKKWLYLWRNMKTSMENVPNFVLTSEWHTMKECTPQIWVVIPYKTMVCVTGGKLNVPNEVTKDENITV
jgi:hypothetical protein